MEVEGETERRYVAQVSVCVGVKEQVDEVGPTCPGGPEVPTGHLGGLDTPPGGSLLEQEEKEKQEEEEDEEEEEEEEAHLAPLPCTATARMRF